MEDLSVPGTSEYLDEINQFVVAASKQAGLEKKSAYNLRLAIDEIATNIVLHGYEENGLSGSVDVKAIIEPDSLTIVLEDTSVPYDPTTRKMPTEADLEKPLEERAIGGLGVFLALKGVDKFTYERVGDRNRNIFMMKRPQ